MDRTHVVEAEDAVLDERSLDEDRIRMSCDGEADVGGETSDGVRQLLGDLLELGLEGGSSECVEEHVRPHPEPKERSERVHVEVSVEIGVLGMHERPRHLVHDFLAERGLKCRTGLISGSKTRNETEMTANSQASP